MKNEVAGGAATGKGKVHLLAPSNPRDGYTACGTHVAARQMTCQPVLLGVTCLACMQQIKLQVKWSTR